MRGIEADVASGALAPGQRLPSVRRLAVDVGLSPVTVAAALAELRRRGVVVTEPRRGTRDRRGAADRLLVVAAAGAGRRARPLARAIPIRRCCPTWAVRSQRSELPARLYGEPQALPRAARAGARAAERRRHPRAGCCASSAARSTGSSGCCEAHLRPGDRVAVENPGYAALYRPAARAGLAARARRRRRPRDASGRSARRPRARRRAPRSSRRAGRTRPARRWTRHGRASSRDVLAGSPNAGCRGRPPRAGRRQRAAHDRRRPARALGGHALGRQGARARPAPGGARRRRARRSLACRGASSAGPAGSATSCRRWCSACGPTPTLRRSSPAPASTYGERRGRLLSVLDRRGVRAHGRLRPERLGSRRTTRLAPWARCCSAAGCWRPARPTGWRGAPPGDPRDDRHADREQEAERLAGDLADVLAPCRSAAADSRSCPSMPSSATATIAPRAGRAPTRSCAACSSAAPTPISALQAEATRARPARPRRSRCASPTARCSARARSTT